MTHLAAPRYVGTGTASWLKGLRIQRRVIGALVIRDALSRYGHANLGFFWIIGEPLMLTSGIMFIWSLTNMTHGSDVGVVPFALTGYSFMTLWRHIVFKSVRVMTQSAQLAFHRHVKFMDVMLARAALETGGIFAAFMVAYLPLCLLGFCPVMRDPLELIGGFLLTAWFSLAFGMVLAGLSELSETLEHFIQPVMYLTLPLTGVFYMTDWLPQKAQQVLLWSPLVNGIEMIRSGLFPAEFPTHWSADYLAACSVVLTSIGLPLCRYAERHIEMA